MAELILLDGATLVVSQLDGEVLPRAPGGFFFRDVRHLSTWRIHVDGKPLHLLTSAKVDYYSARIVGATTGDNEPPVSVRLDRFVTLGIHEDLVVRNNTDRRRRVVLEIFFDADFADVAEARENSGPTEGTVRQDREASGTVFRFERDGYLRGTRLRFSEQPTLRRDRAIFRLNLAPHEEWRTCVDIVPIDDAKEFEPLLRCGGFHRGAPEMPLTLEEWLAEAPALEGGTDAVRHVYRQSLADLASLRLRPNERHAWPVPAGGVPWFMAFFGRDSLVASYEALPFRPMLAAATLVGLAELQATEFDHFRDAEPGKIMHELRLGVLADLGITPHSPYYGSHDATLLFLILLDEYERWTGDRALVRRLEPNARAAVEWMRGPADLDGDGYLEYRSRSDGGLNNHGWKDSDDAIRFADGSVAEAPIATCELQGYAYDARLRVARLAREIWRDGDLADSLEHEAAELSDRFERDFWLGRRRHYALALDGDKRQVDSLTSNVGHLLWSGIVGKERAAMTVKRLMASDMFSGWGIRTLSARNPAYNPFGYHVGAVWPHDTAIVAEGFRRYGFRREAGALAKALFDAAESFEHQLPELFSGLQRDETDVVVEYANALRPQAWAAGAPLLALRTILGLDAKGGRARADPALPPGLERLRLVQRRRRASSKRSTSFASL